MKPLILLTAISIFPFFSFSQSYVPFPEDSAWWSVAGKCNKVVISNPCIVDAGKDTTICVGLYGLDTIYLGGASTAQYGTPPYSYTWSCDYWVAGTLHFTASDFLDDTTVANPRIIDFITAPDYITFYLTVKDSTGLTCSDSVKLRFSLFVYSLAGYDIYMIKGDSIQVFGDGLIGNGIPPLLYTWTPSDGIADIHDSSTKLSPDTTTFYSISAIDSVGCKSDTPMIYRVFVGNTSVNEQYNNASDLFNIYPNPVTDISFLQIPDKNGLYSLNIYDILGRQLVKQELINEEFYYLNKKDFGSGIYYFKLINKKNNYYTGSFVVF